MGFKNGIDAADALIKEIESDPFTREGINTDLFYNKLKNYNKVGTVRAIVNGDAGNVNGLTDDEIIDWLKMNGFDFEIKNKQLYYKPKKKGVK